MSGKIDPQIIKIKLLGLVEKLRHCKPEFKYAAGTFVVGKIFIKLTLSEDDITGFLLTFISPLYDFFSLNSSYIFNFQLWKLVTYSFLEPNLLVILYQTTVAYQFFHLIDPVWGYAESLKFAAIIQVGFAKNNYINVFNFSC